MNGTSPLPTSLRDARSLGRSLRLWRAIRRVKQAHAAELLNVSQATISRWESGTQLPDPDEQAGLRRLLSARLDSAGDHALARLVTQSPLAVHLICDLTHDLLAASPARTCDWRVSLNQTLGSSLWRYASAEIAAAEARLADQGWFDPAPPAIEFVTGANTSVELPIRPSRMRWVRLQLADGAFARLVETMDLGPDPAERRFAD